MARRTHALLNASSVTKKLVRADLFTPYSMVLPENPLLMHRFPHVPSGRPRLSIQRSVEVQG